MNENALLKKSLPFITICGFDIKGIRDFVEAFLEFGV
jgi:hypothetical protein